MRTRHRSYSDYGFCSGESKELKEYIQSPEFSEDELLRESCEKANEQLAVYIYRSLITGLGYVEMSKKTYIPIGSNDFYGWQRKALALFRNARNRGDLEFADKKIQ